MKDKILTIISNKANIPIQDIQTDIPFELLGIDSLIRAEIAFEIDSKLGIKIYKYSPRTVSDLIRLVEEKCENI